MMAFQRILIFLMVPHLWILVHSSTVRDRDIDFFFNVSFFRSNEVEWMNRLLPVASEQFEIFFENERVSILPTSQESTIKMQESEEAVEIWIRKKDDRFMTKTAVIEKATGALTSFRTKSGKDILIG
eukprot:781169_1